MTRYKIEKCSCGGKPTVDTIIVPIRPLFLKKKRERYQVSCKTCGKKATMHVIARFAIMSWNQFHKDDK